MVQLNKGWRYTGFIVGLVGFIGLAMYPIAISPMIDPSKYSELRVVAIHNKTQRFASRIRTVKELVA